MVKYMTFECYHACYDMTHLRLWFCWFGSGGKIIQSLNFVGLSSATLSSSSLKLSVTLSPVLADVSSTGQLMCLQ